MRFDKIKKSDFLIFMLTETITVTEAQKNFSDMINRVHYKGAVLTLTRGKRPVARIMPAGRRSTGADLLKCLQNRPALTKAERERFADAVEAARAEVNIPPTSAYNL